MQPEEKLSVLLADDHAVVRQGLRAFLELQGDITVVGEAGDGQEAIEMAQELLPDVVLMDLVMPEMDGIAATLQIKQTVADCQVLVLTSFAEDQKVRDAIQAGAIGYLLKDVLKPELVRAIHAAAAGQPTLHPEAQRQLIRQVATPTEPSLLHTLTGRETDVLRLIAKGLSNREIATTLHITEGTVKGYVSTILGKLEVNDRTQAALYAVKHKLL